VRRRISFYILFISLIFLVACQMQPEEQRAFESTGQYWKAQINPEVQMIRGKNQFSISFQYLGSLEDIHKTKKIMFAQGTLLDTQVVNVFDLTYKDELIKKNQYKDEDGAYNGIVVEDLKNKKSKEFDVKYMLSENNEMNTFEAINKDRMNIKIRWEIDGKEYNDEIDIRGSDDFT